MNINISNSNKQGNQARNSNVGVVLFDDTFAPQQAWARLATPNTTAFRISGPEELSNSVIWWSNLSAEFFLQNHAWSQYQWIKSDCYPLIRPDEALMEWGLTPSHAEQNQTQLQNCEFLCHIFWRIMNLSFRLIQCIKPDAEFFKVFNTVNLFDALQPLISGPEKSLHNQLHLTKKFDFPSFKIFQNVAKTTHNQFLNLKKPRLTYIRTLLETPILELAYSLKHDSKQPNIHTYLTKLEHYQQHGLTVFTKICIQDVNSATLSSIGYWLDQVHGLNPNYIWVTVDELSLLCNFITPEIHSSYVSRPTASFISVLAEPIQVLFYHEGFASSWTAGIIAEVLWFSILSNHKLLTCPQNTETLLNRLHLHHINKSSMLQAIELLVNSGFSPQGYGFGTISVSLTEQQLIDIVYIGLRTGLVPSMYDIPAQTFTAVQPESWYGCPSSFELVRCQLTKNWKQAWTLDNMPQSRLKLPNTSLN